MNSEPAEDQTLDDDPTWGDFDAAERSKADRLEEDYLEVEAFNRALLNQVAGLEYSELELEEVISKGSDSPVPHTLKLSPTNALLYLRPDRRKQLHDVGEKGSVVFDDGDPHVIVGRIPRRTQELIENLLAGIEAKVDNNRSTPDEEMWIGNIAGQPIEVVKYRSTLSRIVDDRTITEPMLSMRAYRVEKVPSLGWKNFSKIEKIKIALIDHL